MLFIAHSLLRECCLVRPYGLEFALCLALNMTQVTPQAGSMRTRCFGLVQKGPCRLRDESGKQRTLNEGQCFSGLALLHSNTRPAILEASDAHVWLLEGAVFRRLRDRMNQVRRLQVLAQTVKSFDESDEGLSVRSCKDGEVLFRTGDVAQHCFFVLHVRYLLT